MTEKFTGNEIRQQFIDFFVENGHKFVPSSSLVPGGDQTLLFTNAGMVQFKDIFLGTDKRDYSKAVNSQKCMRVAGKHNDLEDVGRDDYHHTFFEMLGNWSFGDYYKKEAIGWAWQLLTDIWGLDKSRFWVTCFKDEQGEIETDEEAAKHWAYQPGLNHEQILFFGRKDNFWEMADTGPCGPSSEIHFDQGMDFCDKKSDLDHVCMVNGDCRRFLELWNLVFIQYNRMSPTDLNPLPAKHVDTGMGFERIVSLIQKVDSNYRTDLLLPLVEVVMELTSDTEKQMNKNFTPYRVIADHGRAAAFLIADGVVPGNVGRNYICRMIIRRAARFGTKLGLIEPFMGKVAQKVIEIYGDAYSELKKNRVAIIDNLTREEQRFQSTVESGLAFLEDEISNLDKTKKKILNGTTAFDLYATHGLPLEITRDVLQERGLEVDQKAFYDAMEEHRLSSGAGKEFGSLGGEDAEYYSNLLEKIKKRGDFTQDDLEHDPYTLLITNARIVAIVKQGEEVDAITQGDEAEIILSKTGFYIEAGGQVADTGMIISKSGSMKFQVDDVRRPAAGVVLHIGKILDGELKIGDEVTASVDLIRRQDIIRNHTATHLLHAELRKVLGEHVRQAGSLVAPDRLRFDFTHPEALTEEQIRSIENGVNEDILNNYHLLIAHKELSEAMDDGAMALFGEKYGEVVRTISIGGEQPFSYELCGGTHVDETAEIGSFVITSESSAAAGIRRIEAVTGRQANKILFENKLIVQRVSLILGSNENNLIQIVERNLKDKEKLEKENKEYINYKTLKEYNDRAKEIEINITINELTTVIPLKIEGTNTEALARSLDEFRSKYRDKNSFAILGTVDTFSKNPVIGQVAVTDTFYKNYNISAGTIANVIGNFTGGGGGGTATLAQFGGTKPEKLEEALSESYLKSKEFINKIIK